MTPKRIAASLRVAGRRLRRERAGALSIAAMGARGDPKEVKKQIADWQRD